MKIGAYHPCSFVDYPKELAAVIFTIGCNMTCPYCHNKGLLNQKVLAQETILNHLRNRVNQLSGVVISGGEPSLQGDLIKWIYDIKKMGYKVKLDTNGTNPKVLKDLIDLKLLDFVAMDIKTLPPAYADFCGTDFQPVEESLELLRAFGHYELRTTLDPELDEDTLMGLCKLYHKDPYVLQKFRPTEERQGKSVDKAALLTMTAKTRITLRGFI